MRSAPTPSAAAGGGRCARSGHRGGLEPYRAAAAGLTREHGRASAHGAPCAVAIAPRGYRESAERSLDVVACACDGGPEARRALTLAAEIARRLGACLHVIGVIAPPTPLDASLAVDPHAAAATRRLRERPADDLRRIVSELDPAARARAVVLHGEAAGELIRASFSVDLMVAGSRGCGPLRAVLARGVSGRLIRSAACPTMIIPRAARTARDEDGALTRPASIVTGIDTPEKDHGELTTVATVARYLSTRAASGAATA
jgi:nucleotide-binding universal stress UspA family protein